MTIKIITDSAADIELADAANNDIVIVPIMIEMEGKSYRDLYDISKVDFYNTLFKISSFPKTSQPTPENFVTYFESAKKLGDDVIVILLSSGLSGTVQSAKIAKDMVDYDRIHIIDSLSAASAEGLLVMQAVTMRNKGCSTKEIVDEINYMVDHLRIVAMVDTLEYLHRGGRLTKTQAKLGNLLNLKPLLEINKEGKLEVFGKCLGRSRAYSAIIEKVAENPIDERYPVYFSYSYEEENCAKLIAKMSKKQEIKYVHPIPMIGSTIGAHVGPGAFGIFYISKN